MQGVPQQIAVFPMAVCVLYLYIDATPFLSFPQTHGDGLFGKVLSQALRSECNFVPEGQHDRS